MAVSMPVYYWLSRWFVERGYSVVLPQRRGYGATGGSPADSLDTCADPDHLRAGLAAAADIGAVLDYMAAEPFVEPNEIVVVGLSTGGWASLAMASKNPESVRAIINFAGGRGGHAWGRPNAICDEQRLIDATRVYGSTARIPTLWLYSRNDSYFAPELAGSMAGAWKAGGGLVELDILSPYGDEGHGVADDRAGWDIWGPKVDLFLSENNLPSSIASSPRPGNEQTSAINSLNGAVASQDASSGGR